MLQCFAECACLHKTVNMAVFFVKSNENTHQKGEHSSKMYRVVPNKKRFAADPCTQTNDDI